MLWHSHYGAANPMFRLTPSTFNYSRLGSHALIGVPLTSACVSQTDVAGRKDNLRLGFISCNNFMMAER